MADYTPQRGSTAGKAIAALGDFGGPMTTGVLCEEIGVEAKQVHQLLAAAIRHGAIIKTVRIAAGLRGGREVVFSLPSHGLEADPPAYGDAKERAQDEAEATQPKPNPNPAKARMPAPLPAAPAVKTAPPAAPRAGSALPAATQGLADIGIEYMPLAQPSRRPVGYWAERLQALANAPINGIQLPTLRFPSEKHKAADSALRVWRKTTKPSAELVCIRMPDHVLIQRVA
jgi:hypothetical protein